MTEVQLKQVKTQDGQIPIIENGFLKIPLGLEVQVLEIIQQTLYMGSLIWSLHLNTEAAIPIIMILLIVMVSSKYSH